MRGLRVLRVVDHALASLITNNHTQSICYLIVSDGSFAVKIERLILAIQGETAADKIIEQ